MSHKSALAGHLLCVLSVVLCAHSSYGQAGALERGSLEAFRAIAEAERQSILARKKWQESKKLSVLKQIPDSPRVQTQCLPPSDLKDGSIGYLEYWQYEVMQVIGPTDVLLSIRNPSIPPIWLTDYATNGLVDGDKARITGLIQVDGTNSYTTVAGAKKTVRVIRFVSEREARNVSMTLRQLPFEFSVAS